MSKIRLVIVDDIQEIRNYLLKVVSKQDDMEVIGTAASGAETLELLKKVQPDVILLDVQMETKTAGLHCAEYINKHYPEIKVVVLTIHEEDELLFQAYSVGVMDYIVKSNTPEQIIHSIREVNANNLIMRPEIADKIVSEFAKLRAQNRSLLFTMNVLSKLSNSEFEVLKCIYEGQNYKEIANTRFVSSVTIKTQVNSILKKFEMRRMKDVIKLLKELDFEEIVKFI